MATTARDFIPIYKNDDGYYVENKTNSNSLFQAEKVRDVVAWVEDNYAQYRNVLVQRERN